MLRSPKWPAAGLYDVQSEIQNIMKNNTALALSGVNQITYLTYLHLPVINPAPPPLTVN